MQKILIVEDDFKMLDALKRNFTEEGFEVITARNGKDGLAKMKDDLPNIVLLDLLMPVMNGVDMLKEMKSNRATKDVPVILLTNLEPDKLLLDQLEEYPPAFYLVKSNVDLDDVVNKVNDVLGNSPPSLE
ncbi:response regulator [Candidatus Dojkabacteria bacterium]|uniref:Response regulator n=1 Tax=Candidatus Dojkabacteria bacterium TaxID=2099670 RepID=A0A955RJM8_9BACT|nr:response regulator [Candidatus Dojkabacteria bacterium]